MIRYGGEEKERQDMLSDSIELGVFKVVDCPFYRFCSLTRKFDVEFDKVMISWEKISWIYTVDISDELQIIAKNTVQFILTQMCRTISHLIQ